MSSENNRYSKMFEKMDRMRLEGEAILASLPTEKAPREQRQNLNQASN